MTPPGQEYYITIGYLTHATPIVQARTGVGRQPGVSSIVSYAGLGGFLSYFGSSSEGYQMNVRDHLDNKSYQNEG